MINFLFFILFFTVLGIQIGIILVLREKKVPLLRALLHSTVIYFLPFIMVAAHFEMYKERYILLSELLEENSISLENYKIMQKKMGSGSFLILVVAWAIKDLLTPKDNILFMLECAEEYEKKYLRTPKKVRERVQNDIGFVGLASVVLHNVLEVMKEHAGNSLMQKKLA
ncbi:hypothetical protein [Psychrobacillus sp. FSL K6-1267]|uniref:hypothetical protein n=1 Tax=Psychrobacillus sp. FSL K6-1267 TaxID=2921543 RepID=UPI0030F61A9B